MLVTGNPETIMNDLGTALSTDAKNVHHLQSISFFATVPTVGTTQIFLKVARVDRGEYGYARVYGNDGSYFQANVTNGVASGATFTDAVSCSSGCAVTTSSSSLRRLLENASDKFDSHFPELRQLSAGSQGAIFDAWGREMEFCDKKCSDGQPMVYHSWAVGCVCQKCSHNSWSQVQLCRSVIETK